MVHGFAQALEKAADFDSNEAMVIGGAEIYRLALNMADRIFLTEVHVKPEGDAHFPDFERANWREISREKHPSGENGEPGYDFVVLEHFRVNMNHSDYVILSRE